jgi:DNA-binding LacI/PurR family transcriptional regulator
MPSTLRKIDTIGFEGLANYLRHQIASGQIKDGERLPSFTELQSKVGAATSTINRAMIVLEQEGLVARERRRGVFATPHRKKNRDTKGIIGISGSAFLSSIGLAYWAQLLHGIRQRAREMGMEVLLVDTTPSTDWEKADGFLFCDWSGHHIRPLVPPEVPCVSLLSPLPGIASVTADDYAGEKMATEYLLSLGHRRIAFLHGGQTVGRDNTIEIVKRRLAGYRDALLAAGIKPNKNWVRNVGGFYNKPEGPSTGEQFVSSGRDSMKAWLDAGWGKLGCTAILAHNDEVAIGIIHALTEQGMAVPRDVSVIGFDGAETHSYFRPSLTTVDLPLETIGAMAVEALLPQLEDDRAGRKSDRTRHTIAPVALKVGESTCAPRS